MENLYDYIKSVEPRETEPRHLEKDPLYFIEIGVNTVKKSNCKPFIEDGYSTLLVEPNPDSLFIIKEEMETLPSNITLEPSAIYYYDGEVDFFSSYMSDRGWSRIDNNTFSRIKGTMEVTGEGFDIIKVPCITLDTLFVRHPEFLYANIVSIDVEGNDELILGQIMNSNWRPKYIMVEDMGDKTRRNEQKYILSNDYELKTTLINDNNGIYVLK